MGCVKLHILDEQYKNTELRVSYFNKELTPNFCAENPRSVRVYAWCGNNPVNRVDPTGLIDYKINGNGYIYDSSSLWDKIKRLWNGPDKTDKLIAPNGKTLEMSAGTMKDFTDKKDDNGMKIGQSFKIENFDVAEQVHEFLSENVKKVEYGVVDNIKNGVASSTITTTLKYEGNNAHIVAENLLVSGADVLQITHNHPKDVPLGAFTTLSPEDKGAFNYLNTKFPNSFIEHRIYEPNTKMYIYYNGNGIIKTTPKKLR